MVASTPEVEWNETEREWMLALARYKADLCPLCGGPRGECTAPDADQHFEALLPVRCHRTTVIRRAQAARPRTPDTHDDALLWGAITRPDT